MTQVAPEPGGSSGRRLSLAEWAALDEEISGEYVDGRLEEEEMPDYVHELVVGWLIRVSGNWAETLGAFVGGSGAKLVLADDRGRKPDVTIYFADSELPPARGLIDVPPDIAIEVVSPSPRDQRRDRVEKLAEYARFGVRYYWLVDPELRSFEVLELSSARVYGHVLGATSGTITSVPGCPGLVLDLDALWAKVDRLKRK